jgi:succinate dehydrogenase / fumarate reductase flavoprotein subunit
MHGSNRLGGNSLSDLLVFGRRAGAGAVEYLDSLGGVRPAVNEEQLESVTEAALAPLDREGENPYAVWHDLQSVMQDLVGIIRRKDELETALQKLIELRKRVAAVGVNGGRRYNPGWHLALDLRNMLVVSECTARAALEREESRGGHTRDDFPEMRPEWRKVNLVCSLDGEDATLERKGVPEMRPELLTLFDRAELAKYLTDEELAEYDAVTGAQEGDK